jgi:hypothetical protein
VPIFRCLRRFKGPVHILQHVKFLRRVFVSPSFKPQVAESPIISRPRLFIEYFRSYPPYLDGNLSINYIKMSHNDRSSVITYGVDKSQTSSSYFTNPYVSFVISFYPFNITDTRLSVYCFPEVFNTRIINSLPL